ncbi:hypothetical protein [Streptomyces cellulosae]|uniref:Uncharacterized protein n=1 Tax=Streptomyces cellulosae TaxID=1968 RepID=A0ABW7YG09_STRCE
MINRTAQLERNPVCHNALTAPAVELLSVRNVTGQEIEQDVWYTADAE